MVNNGHGVENGKMNLKLLIVHKIPGELLIIVMDVLNRIIMKSNMVKNISTVQDVQKE